MKNFLKFIKDQNILGLTIGFLLATSVGKVVSALVTDIVNPILGIFFGFTGTLNQAVLKLGPVEITWGHFAATLIDFLIIAFVIYVFVRVLRFDKK